MELVVGEMESMEPRHRARKTAVDALGLSAEGIPARLLRDLGIEGGVEVGYVDTSGAAWQGGIREGDIILRIDRRPVAGIDAYRKTVGDIRRGNLVSVLLMREGSQMYVAFRAR